MGSSNAPKVYEASYSKNNFCTGIMCTFKFLSKLCDPPAKLPNKAIPHQNNKFLTPSANTLN